MNPWTGLYLLTTLAPADRVLVVVAAALIVLAMVFCHGRR